MDAAASADSRVVVFSQMKKNKKNDKNTNNNNNILIEEHDQKTQEDERFEGYGETEEDAQKSFEEVFTTSMAYMVNKNSLHDDLKKHGWNIRGKKSHDLKSPKFEDMYKTNKEFKDIIDNKPYQKIYKDVCIPA